MNRRRHPLRRCRDAVSQRGASSLLCLLALCGPCSPFTPAEPVAAGQLTPLELTVVGGAELNPNSQGRASPVEVTVFDLTAAPAFEAADFQSLIDRPADVLGSNLVARDEFVLRPGDIQPRNRAVQPEVRILGVVAAFRDLEHGVWRLSVAVMPGRRNFLLIDLDRNVARVETVDTVVPSGATVRASGRP